MERTLIGDLNQKIGEEILIKGWVDVRRDHGKLIFIDLRDRSGLVQMVVLPNHEEAHKIAGELRSEWTIAIRGQVNKRPDKMVKASVLNGDIEIEVQEITVLSAAQELPFEKDAEVNLDTMLDYRPLTLRSERERHIFRVQAVIVQAYRQSLIRQGFTEFQAPAIVGGDAEGGAAVFKLDYFYDQKACLATSPQFYKEIMVGPFERSFTVAKIFRAEKSATTRHLAEIMQMDFEMGFINDHRDVMAVLEQVIRDTVAEVTESQAAAFKFFETVLPALPTEPFPVLRLTEAQEIIEKEFGIKAIGEEDMAPEHERLICEWALKQHGSDFAFITHYPTAVRAFYTYEDPTEKPYSRSFDLLYRGLEINSGSQRFHDHDKLVERMRERGLDPDKFQFYLQAFKYGLPPHGGCSTGLERITARMLDLPNVKEASAFPRDLNRIDSLLSK